MQLSFIIVIIVTRNGKSLETRAELAVLRTYVENQAILLYRAKCKQTKKQGSEDCLWNHIFIVLCDYYQFFFFFLSKCKYNWIKLCYNRLQFVKETQISTVSSTERRAKLRRFFFNALLGANCTLNFDLEYIGLKKLIIKILNLKLLILLEYQSIKMFLQKVTLQIGLIKIFD